MDIADYREAELAKIAQSPDRIVALQLHLGEIIEGKSFKGSHRSGQFLKYIVDQAIAGHFELLKERVIGAELFGRSPAYDTGEDAIVRVTASDVRKRLLQHYDRQGPTSEFRINLPLGSYIPEILCDHQNGTDAPGAAKAPQDSVAIATVSGLAVQYSTLQSAPSEKPVAAAPPVPNPEAAPNNKRSRRLWLTFATLVTALNLALFGLSWKGFSRTEALPVPVLPWSAFFSSPHPTHLITSDPNIAEIQALAGIPTPISVSDYANHNYIPEPNTLTPEVRALCAGVLNGNKAATVDTQIVADVAELAESNLRKIDVRPARSIRISDLRTEDNFIFLGSPRSNPWSSLFTDQLDFQFSAGVGQAIIRNVHPVPGEQPSYIPTAKGGATGQTFAIIAYLQDLEETGQVVLLAGADAEGTAAAGKFATDLPRLTTALQKCGISSPSPLRHFELLLRLNTIAGSPTTVDVAACHILPDSAAR